MDSKQKCVGGHYFCCLVYTDDIIAPHFLLVTQKEVLSSVKAPHSAASQHRNLPSPFCPELRSGPGSCFCCGSRVSENAAAVGSSFRTKTNGSLLLLRDTSSVRQWGRLVSFSSLMRLFIWCDETTVTSETVNPQRAECGAVKHSNSAQKFTSSLKFSSMSPSLPWRWTSPLSEGYFKGISEWL